MFKATYLFNCTKRFDNSYNSNYFLDNLTDDVNNS